MSDSIFRIWSIARYEAKVIMRGWLYRIAFLAPLVILAVFLFSNVFHNRFTMSLLWGFFIMPSSMAWMVTILFTVYSCIVLGAIVTNSGSLEWRLDTFDGARVRSWTNIEYAAGKIAGQIFCFLMMTAAVIAFTVGITIFSPGVVLSFPAGFLLYPLIISLPSFFFVAGFSVFITRVVRSQMVSLLIVTALIVFSVITADRLFHLFDITAFRIPLVYSNITGFSFPQLIARQRLMFFSSGLMMVCAAVLGSRRLPGRRSTPIITLIAMVSLLAVSLYSGSGYAGYFLSGVRLRERIRRTSSSLRPLPFLRPLEYDIDLKQAGNGIVCTSRIVLENGSDSSVDSYVLTLNPGLFVTDVSGRYGSIDFKRDAHILTLFPRVPLPAGEKDTVAVEYSGVVDGRAMYSDVPERIRGADNTIRGAASGTGSKLTGLSMFRLPRDLAPLQYDYLLLVPASMWYPVPGLPYDPRYPGEDRKEFSSFRIRVHPHGDLKAVSQGKRTIIGDGDYLFEPEHPMAGITLAIGDFRTRTVEVDSLPYHLYSTKASEGLIKMLECMADTLPDLIRDRKELLEYSLGLDYPFERLTLLEVPISFTLFNRPLREAGFGYVQPEIILLHEGGVSTGLLSSLPAWLDMDREDYTGKEQIKEERKRSTIFMALTGVIVTLYRDSSFSVFPMYFNYVTGIRSTRHPHVGLLMEHMARERVRIFESNRYSSAYGITGSERASRMILTGGLIEASMDPENYGQAGYMISSWASHHYYLIDALSEDGSINRFVRDLVEANQFSNIDEEEFFERFAEKFGFRLESTLIDLENPVDVPGYVFGDYDLCSFVDGERELYRLSFDVMNREGMRGVLVVTATMNYPRGVRKTLKLKMKSPVLALEVIEPGDSRHIEIIFEYEPRAIIVNTMLSRNIPSKMTWGPGLKIRGACGRGSRDDTGIDLSDFDDRSIIVDDIDTGFETIGGNGETFLRRLSFRQEKKKEFISGSQIRIKPPNNWTAAVDGGFFGLFVRSARCIRAGNGKSKAIWRASVAENGFYDVYTYIYDPYRRFSSKSRSRKGLDRIEYHYIVHHSDGSSEVMLMPDQCEDGWNLLGKYYFEEGEAVVELSDESPVLYVIADAVKWVKKD